MTHRTIKTDLCLGGFILLFLAMSFPGTVSAFPSRWTSRCVSCHTDDTPSCNGCHQHRGTVAAVPNHPVYNPGDVVTITLSGGDEDGWIRGLLYDQNHVEIDRASGPTGTGDNGQPNPVTFPVTLQATAPVQPGTYTWQAGWFGGATTGGGVHLEDLVDVVIQVSGEQADEGRTWGAIKSLYR
jgi:hypothetical protein